jgi:diguanylate cyclase (GGDEF)-like protein/PAS domain S-box-containing protein
MRLHRTFTLRWLLLTVGVVSAAAAWLWHDHEDTLNSAALQQQNVSRLLEMHTTHVIRNANGVLDRVIDEVADHDILGAGADRRWPVFSAMADHLPVSGRLWLYRADGTAVMASHLRNSGNNASDREYFTAHREGRGGLFIGETVVGKTTGNKVFNISRRLEGPDGAFAGVAMAAIDIDVFIQAVADLKLGSSAAYTLAREDGAIIMRYPDLNAAGKRFNLAVLGEVKKAAAGVYTTTSLVDGVERQLAYRKHPTLPLVVIVSLSREDILAPWRQRLVATTFGLALLIGLATWLTFKSGEATRRERHAVSQMQTVLDAVAEGICGLDTNGKVAFMNRAGAKLLGCEPDELIGKPLPVRAPDSSAGGIAADMACLQATGQALASSSGTTTVFNRNGLPTVVEYTANAAQDHADQPGMVVSFRDVGPLIASRNALRDQKEFVTCILDSLTEQVAVIDRNGVITTVNEAWRQFAQANGAPGAERVSEGANYLEVCRQAVGQPGAAEASDTLAGITAVLSGKSERFTLDYPCHAPSEERWFIMVVLPLKGADGGAVISHQNHTDRYLAEESLRASEVQFRMLAENMVDMVWKADKDMRFTYINDADRRVRGFERDEVIGHTIMETLTPEGQGILAAVRQQRQTLEDSGHGGEAMRVEFPQRCKNGGEVWTEVTTMPVYDAHGHINGYQGIGRDVTARKLQERVDMSQRQELEIQLADAEVQKADLLAQANRDALTAVHNRRYLHEWLPRELVRATREGLSVAVIMVDLDHFKRVNDTYGHPAGDDVLRTLAALLKSCARESDLICRYGGEEFVIVMPGMTTQGAWERVDRLRTTLGDTAVMHGDVSIHVTLSAGVAAFPEHGTDELTLLANADHALYQAKHSGRNQVMVFQPQA